MAQAIAVNNCTICERSEDEKDCFTQCIACSKWYCEECSTFNEKDWRSTHTREKYIGGGWEHSMPLYDQCLACVDADQAQRRRDILKNRVANKAENCFRCREYVGGTNCDGARCKGCQRKWCPSCEDLCAGADAMSYNIIRGIYITGTHVEYSSCAMCRDSAADESCVEEIVNHLVHTVKKINAAEFYKLGGVNEEEVTAEVKRRILRAAMPRKK